MKILNKFTGCLFGGAVGDALGYPVELMKDTEIKQQFGEKGIRIYPLQENIAPISDDTQLTLFTANALISGFTNAGATWDKDGFMDYIRLGCLDWYKTQTLSKPDLKLPKSSWIANVPSVYHRRAPGSTIFTSCLMGANGTIQNPINNSCGCGGLMHVAPIGLMFNTKNGYTIEQIDMFGAEVAALTHGHPLGYIPAAALVHIINRLVYTKMKPNEAVLDSVEYINQIFKSSEHLCKLTSMMKTAVNMAKSNQDDIFAIHQFGRGWTADEALAISIYCAIKYANNFKEGVIAAVNHRGDSDATGSITGNILGAYLGFDDIESKYRQNIELRDMIIEIATDLYYCGVPSITELMKNEIWQQKYSKLTYDKI